MYTSNADEVLRALNTERDDLKKRAGRFALGMAEEFKSRLIRRIDNTFGERARTSRSTVSRMSARKLGASGGLRNSVATTVVNDQRFIVSVGNSEIPYAAIHEHGGEIKPKSSKYLTIPASISGGRLDFFNPITSGQRAGEFNLKFQYLEYNGRGGPRIGKFLTFRTAVRQTKSRTARANSVAYFLAKRVNMPKRPYFQPAVDDLLNDSSAIREQMMIAGFHSSWEVRMQ